MRMTPVLRKAALTAHIMFSVGWIGAVASFLALAIAGLSTNDVALVRAACLGMEWVAWFVIVPLAFGSLLTGFVVSLATPWGLLRHYWVLMKFLLTLPMTLLLLIHAQPVSRLARLATETVWSTAEIGRLQSNVLRDAAFAGVVLLLITTLSVYKPWGRTRYGRRKQQQERLDALAATSPTATARLPVPANQTANDGLPKGLRVFLAVVAVLAVAFVMSHHGGGGHGGHAH